MFIDWFLIHKHLSLSCQVIVFQFFKLSNISSSSLINVITHDHIIIFPSQQLSHASKVINLDTLQFTLPSDQGDWYDVSCDSVECSSDEEDAAENITNHFLKAARPKPTRSATTSVKRVVTGQGHQWGLGGAWKGFVSLYHIQVQKIIIISCCIWTGPLWWIITYYLLLAII